VLFAFQRVKSTSIIIVGFELEKSGQPVKNCKDLS
jgi:hypothetical protein